MALHFNSMDTKCPGEYTWFRTTKDAPASTGKISIDSLYNICASFYALGWKSGSAQHGSTFCEKKVQDGFLKALKALHARGQSGKSPENNSTLEGNNFPQSCLISFCALGKVEDFSTHDSGFIESDIFSQMEQSVENNTFMAHSSSKILDDYEPQHEIPMEKDSPGNNGGFTENSSKRLHSGCFYYHPVVNETYSPKYDNGNTKNISTDNIESLEEDLSKDKIIKKSPPDGLGESARCVRCARCARCAQILKPDSLTPRRLHGNARSNESRTSSSLEDDLSSSDTAIKMSDPVENNSNTVYSRCTDSPEYDEHTWSGLTWKECSLNNIRRYARSPSSNIQAGDFVARERVDQENELLERKRSFLDWRVSQITRVEERLSSGFDEYPGVNEEEELSIKNKNFREKTSPFIHHYNGQSFYTVSQDTKLSESTSSYSDSSSTGTHSEEEESLEDDRSFTASAFRDILLRNIISTYMPSYGAKSEEASRSFSGNSSSHSPECDSLSGDALEEDEETSDSCDDRTTSESLPVNLEYDESTCQTAIEEEISLEDIKRLIEKSLPYGLEREMLAWCSINWETGAFEDRSLKIASSNLIASLGGRKEETLQKTKRNVTENNSTHNAESDQLHVRSVGKESVLRPRIHSELTDKRCWNAIHSNYAPYDTGNLARKRGRYPQMRSSQVLKSDRLQSHTLSDGVFPEKKSRSTVENVQKILKLDVPAVESVIAEDKSPGNISRPMASPPRICKETLIEGVYSSDNSFSDDSSWYSSEESSSPDGLDHALSGEVHSSDEEKMLSLHDISSHCFIEVSYDALPKNNCSKCTRNSFPDVAECDKTITGEDDELPGHNTSVTDNSEPCEELTHQVLSDKEEGLDNKNIMVINSSRDGQDDQPCGLKRGGFTHQDKALDTKKMVIVNSALHGLERGEQADDVEASSEHDTKESSEPTPTTLSDKGELSEKTSSQDGLESFEKTDLSETKSIKMQTDFPAGLRSADDALNSEEHSSEHESRIAKYSGYQCDGPTTHTADGQFSEIQDSNSRPDNVKCDDLSSPKLDEDANTSERIDKTTGNSLEYPGIIDDENSEVNSRFAGNDFSDGLQSDQISSNTLCEELDLTVNSQSFSDTSSLYSLECYELPRPFCAEEEAQNNRFTLNTFEDDVRCEGASSHSVSEETDSSSEHGSSIVSICSTRFQDDETWLHTSPTKENVSMQNTGITEHEGSQDNSSIYTGSQGGLESDGHSSHTLIQETDSSPQDSSIMDNSQADYLEQEEELTLESNTRLGDKRTLQGTHHEGILSRTSSEQTDLFSDIYLQSSQSDKLSQNTLGESTEILSDSGFMDKSSTDDPDHDFILKYVLTHSQREDDEEIREITFGSGNDDI